MRFTHLALFLLILGATSASAETLTWDQAVADTAKNNADLASFQQSLNAAEYQSKAAFGAFLPQISGTLGYDRGNSTGTTANSYIATLNGSQNLFSGFADRAKLDQTAANRDLALANLDSTRAKVSSDLKAAYATLSYAQGFVTLSDDIVKRRQANLDLVELQFEGGQENKGSFLLSKATLSQAQFDNLQARDSIEVNRQALARMLGRNEPGDLIVAGTVPVLAPSGQPDFERLVEQSPSHRQVAATERVSQALLTIARSQFYPSLDLAGSYGRQGSFGLPQDNRWNVGLTLSVPLFNGGRDYYTAKAASAALASAFSNRTSVDRQVRATLKQAYAAYFEAVEKLNVDNEFLNAATVRAEIGRHRYSTGLLSFENWDIIENDLITRQKAALASQLNRITAEAAWEQAQGKGVIP